MYRAGGAVIGGRSSSGAIGSRLSRFWGSSVVSMNVPVLGSFLTPYPKTSAGDPGGHGNHQRDPHRRTGRDAGRGGGAGSDHHEQFDGSDFPVGHPEVGHPHIQMPVRRGDLQVAEKYIRHVRVVVLASRCLAFLVGSDPEVLLDVLRLPSQAGVLADRGLQNLVAGEQLGDDIALLVETLNELPLLRGKW